MIVLSTFGVILDACVLIPAALRDTLLRAAEYELYRLHWSEDILQEVQRNLVEHHLTNEAKALRLVDAIRDAFPEASVLGYQRLVRTMPNHPKDRHVLAAAVVSHAQVIVTINLRDFRSKDLDLFGIEAQSPDEFLGRLFELSPRLMSRIVAEQSGDLQSPPVTVESLLDRLATQHAQGFADLVRAYRAKGRVRE